MLSGEALDLAFALRAKVGALSQGDGPSLDELRDASGISHSEFDRALAELESVGFVGIDRTAPMQAVVVVLAPLQIYLDDLESQGGDDF
jgi:predicted transcriptional regulator